MDAIESCDLIIKAIKDSNLHYILHENAFSVQIKLRKKFIENNPPKMLPLRPRKSERRNIPTFPKADPFLAKPKPISLLAPPPGFPPNLPLKKEVNHQLLHGQCNQTKPSNSVSAKTFPSLIPIISPTMNLSQPNSPKPISDRSETIATTTNSFNQFLTHLFLTPSKPFQSISNTWSDESMFSSITKDTNDNTFVSNSPAKILQPLSVELSNLDNSMNHKILANNFTQQRCLSPHTPPSTPPPLAGAVCSLPKPISSYFPQTQSGQHSPYSMMTPTTSIRQGLSESDIRQMNSFYLGPREKNKS